MRDILTFKLTNRRKRTSLVLGSKDTF